MFIVITNWHNCHFFLCEIWQPKNPDNYNNEQYFLKVVFDNEPQGFLGLVVLKLWFIKIEVLNQITVYSETLFFFIFIYI